MNRITWPALAGLLLSVASIALAGESHGYAPPKPTTVYTFCIGTQPKHQLTDESMVPDAVYYSGAFSMMSNESSEVNKTFTAFLEERYDFKSVPSLAQPITCHQHNTLAEAQDALQTNLSRSQKYSHLQTVVDTGWTWKTP